MKILIAIFLAEAITMPFQTLTTEDICRSLLSRDLNPQISEEDRAWVAEECKKSAPFEGGLTLDRVNLIKWPGHE